MPSGGANIVAHIACDFRRLSRVRLPVDTVELAEFLIGKTIVRDMGRPRDKLSP
jgi:hypothetical protein